MREPELADKPEPTTHVGEDGQVQIGDAENSEEMSKHNVATPLGNYGLA